MNVVAVDRVDVEQSEASAGADELVGDGSNAILAMTPLD